VRPRALVGKFDVAQLNPGAAASYFSAAPGTVVAALLGVASDGLSMIAPTKLAVATPIAATDAFVDERPKTDMMSVPIRRGSLCGRCPGLRRQCHSTPRLRTGSGIPEDPDLDTHVPGRNVGCVVAQDRG
jgi:hypothetical protein